LIVDFQRQHTLLAEMNSGSMKLELRRPACAAALALICLLAPSSLIAASVMLEGQNKGDTNTWTASNLQNWLELDFIPCRVHMANNQGSNQTFTIYFEHYNGTTPGIQNLFSFTTSSNVVFAAPPSLFAPPTATSWSYTFTISVLD